MEKIAPPSSPMMTVAPAETPPEPPLLTDDIEDPPVPPGTIDVAPVPPDASMLTPPTVTIPDALVPLAHGFCQYLQSRMHSWLMDEHRQMMTAMDGAMGAVRDWAKEVFQANEHAQYQLADALLKIQAGGVTQTTGTPYTAVVDARTPHGFPLRLTIEKGTSGELIEELGRLEGWLVANGYSVGEVAAA